MRKDRRMERHFRETTFDDDSHEGDTTAHGIGVSGTVIRMIQAPLDKPHTLSVDPFEIWHFHASLFPNGVTITDCGFDLSGASAGYSVDFMKLTSPTDASPVTIETVATVGGAEQAEDDGTIDNPDLAAGDLLYVSLPATAMNECHVWVTFTID